MAMVKKAKTKKKKENRNPNKNINHVVMGTSAICISGTHSMNFLSFAHLYRQTELDRPRVLRKTDFLVHVQACTSFFVTNT